MEFKFEVTEFSQFLQEELTISSAEIALVMQKKRGIKRTYSHASLAIRFIISLTIRLYL